MVSVGPTARVDLNLRTCFLLFQGLLHELVEEGIALDNNLLVGASTEAGLLVLHL